MVITGIVWMQESHILFLANVFSCICIILHCLVARVDKSLAVDKSGCKNCGLAFIMVLPIAVYFIHNGVISVIGNGPKKGKAKLWFFLKIKCSTWIEICDEQRKQFHQNSFFIIINHWLDLSDSFPLLEHTVSFIVTPRSAAFLISHYYHCK